MALSSPSGSVSSRGPLRRPHLPPSWQPRKPRGSFLDMGASAPPSFGPPSTLTISGVPIVTDAESDTASGSDHGRPGLALGGDLHSESGEGEFSSRTSASSQEHLSLASMPQRQPPESLSDAIREMQVKAKAVGGGKKKASSGEDRPQARKDGSSSDVPKTQSRVAGLVSQFESPSEVVTTSPVKLNLGQTRLNAEYLRRAQAIHDQYAHVRFPSGQWYTDYSSAFSACPNKAPMRGDHDGESIGLLGVVISADLVARNGTSIEALRNRFLSDLDASPVYFEQWAESVQISAHQYYDAVMSLEGDSPEIRFLKAEARYFGTTPIESSDDEDSQCSRGYVAYRLEFHAVEHGMQQMSVQAVLSPFLAAATWSTCAPDSVDAAHALITHKYIPFSRYMESFYRSVDAQCSSMAMVNNPRLRVFHQKLIEFNEALASGNVAFLGVCFHELQDLMKDLVKDHLLPEAYRVNLAEFAREIEQSFADAVEPDTLAQFFYFAVQLISPPASGEVAVPAPGSIFAGVYQDLKLRLDAQSTVDGKYATLYQFIEDQSDQQSSPIQRLLAAGEHFTLKSTHRDRVLTTLGEMYGDHHFNIRFTPPSDQTAKKGHRRIQSDPGPCRTEEFTLKEASAADTSAAGVSSSPSSAVPEVPVPAVSASAAPVADIPASVVAIPTAEVPVPAVSASVAIPAAADIPALVAGIPVAPEVPVPVVSAAAAADIPASVVAIPAASEVPVPAVSVAAADIPASVVAIPAASEVPVPAVSAAAAADIPASAAGIPSGVFSHASPVPDDFPKSDSPAGTSSPIEPPLVVDPPFGGIPAAPLSSVNPPPEKPVAPTVAPYKFYKKARLVILLLRFSRLFAAAASASGFSGSTQGAAAMPTGHTPDQGGFARETFNATAPDKYRDAAQSIRKLVPQTVVPSVTVEAPVILAPNVKLPEVKLPPQKSVTPLPSGDADAEFSEEDEDFEITPVPSSASSSSPSRTVTPGSLIDEQEADFSPFGLDDGFDRQPISSRSTSPEDSAEESAKRFTPITPFLSTEELPEPSSLTRSTSSSLPRPTPTRLSDTPVIDASEIRASSSPHDTLTGLPTDFLDLDKAAAMEIGFSPMVSDHFRSNSSALPDSAPYSFVVYPERSGFVVSYRVNTESENRVVRRLCQDVSDVEEFCATVQRYAETSSPRTLPEGLAIFSLTPDDGRPTPVCMKDPHRTCRYTNILPPMRTMVGLTPDEQMAVDRAVQAGECLDIPRRDKGQAQLFPANHIRDRHLIACEGPKTTNVDAFWNMVWQQDTTVIGMVTGLVEGGREKCTQYWPLQTDEVLRLPDDMTITMKSDTPVTGEDYTLRIFEVTKHGETRTVYQFHFTEWPDHGVPQDKADRSGAQRVTRFVQCLRNAQDELGGRMIVHCSAGVGRTGTVLAIDAALEMRDQHLSLEQFNLSDTLARLREDRGSQVVQTEDQEFLVYNAVCDIATQA